ncbi:uncharacterized protein LOC102715867 [Oryza brachyantha]|uniref:RanBP2-type domain-containing protein n=1 Tax=Oryza brachyantha TaxID=4533 RepID=J3MK61_ORYBR|nr:uncharacterized protein LOC102715867 [Oryza brachyantha]
MTSYVASLLRRRRLRLRVHRTMPTLLLPRLFSSPHSPSPVNSVSSKPPSLSARLSFVFDQLDALDRSRSSDLSARDAALRRIQSWRRPAALPEVRPMEGVPSEPEKKEAEAVGGEELERMSVVEVLRREVELVHPWPEWIELMDRLAQQKYFDLGGAGGADEGCMAAAVPMDLAEVAQETGFDFSRDWTTVKNACMNFGRDRFDILKSLPRKDLQVLVGHGCPSMDPKVVFSAKLIRKLVHLDEGDVCSSCNLRNLCSRGYILTRKEDEARTLDVMRILLVYGFDHVKETVENKPLKLKSVKTVVRKLIHDIAKLSAVPIDPNLPPPIIRKPPPKVKQPPPPPKKRVGRDNVEMKKGDWLCPKCDFMNFAKNNICLQCDSKRPKRQLLPGEWECPRCNFLNYRRNMSCFHCEHKRPPDEYTNNQMESNQFVPQKRLGKPARRCEVSNAWNFDFDDNESDGADVAAFEFADPSKARESLSMDNTSSRGGSKFSEDNDFGMNETWREGTERRFSERDRLCSSRVGFDDFDDEEDDDIDSYELDLSKGDQADGVSRMTYSDFEDASDSADLNERANIRNSKHGEKQDIIGSLEDDKFNDHPSLRSSHLAASWQQTVGWNCSNKHTESFASESDDGVISDLDEDINDGFKCKESYNKHNPSRAVVRHHVPFPDMDCDMGGRFQSDRRNRFSREFSNEFPARASNSNSRSTKRDTDGRTKMNERFKSSNMCDRSHRASASEVHNGSRDLQNIRRNWVKSGAVDDDNRPLRCLNRNRR